MSCEGCGYAILLSGAWCCDYLSITGHRRPCPPGAACTVRVAAKKDPKRKWKEHPPVKRRTWDTKKALELYCQGQSDGAIAAAVGTTRNAVAFWRREQGLPGGRDRRDLAAPPEAAPGEGPVAFSVEYRGCALSIRAPDTEGLRQIYAYAGTLLRDMPAAERRES